MGRPSRELRKRSFALLGLAFLLGLGVYSGISAGAGAPEGPSLGTLVRLHDLQPGYVVGEGKVGCGGFETEGAEPPLAEFVVTYRPRGCEAEYNRLYRVPGPKPNPGVVNSFVVDARSAAGVAAAERVAPELLARLTGNIEPQEVPPTAAIGTGTRLFHTRYANILGRNGRGSIFLWRYGNLLGATLAGGGAYAATDAIAARLARLQLSRMEKPVRYTEAQRDDLLVPLDNPAIKLPLYWLGRNFHPGGGHAPMPLTFAHGPLAEGQAPPGTRIELWYGGGAIRIGTWTRAGWNRYTQTKLGRILLTWNCTQTTALPSSAGKGSAVVYRGYAKDFDDCPDRPPRVFAAVIHIGRVVLGVNLPPCYSCLESIVSGEVLAGVARDLRLRPQRDFGRD